MPAENDHDLLVVIKTQLERAISDIKELKDNFANRVHILEEEKASKEEVQTLKKAVELIQQRVWMIVGGLLLSQVVLVPLVIKYLIK